MSTRMLFKFPEGSDKRKQTNDVITAWLNERQDLIVSLEKLGGIHPMPNIISLEFNEQLSRSLNLIVDYISKGHFEVFEKMYEVEKQITNYNLYDADEFKTILLLNDIPLDFEEKYRKYSINHDKEINENEFREDLGRLLLSFEERFELEDELIRKYIKALDIEAKQELQPKKPTPRN